MDPYRGRRPPHSPNTLLRLPADHGPPQQPTKCLLHLHGDHPGGIRDVDGGLSGGLEPQILDSLVRTAVVRLCSKFVQHKIVPAVPQQDLLLLI